MAENLSVNELLINSQLRTIIGSYAGDRRQHAIEIATFIGRSYLNYTDKDISLLNMFWNVAFNKKWLYCPKELVIKLFGYADGRSTMNHFYENILSKFKENIDYKIVDVNHELVKSFTHANVWVKLEVGGGNDFTPTKVGVKTEIRGGSMKKYYIISGKTLKKIFMAVRTADGEDIRDYYFNVENLSILTLELISEFASIELQESSQRLQQLNNQVQSSTEQLQIKEKEVADANMQVVKIQQDLLQITNKVQELTIISNNDKETIEKYVEFIAVNGNTKQISAFM